MIAHIVVSLFSSSMITLRFVRFRFKVLIVKTLEARQAQA